MILEFLDFLTTPARWSTRVNGQLHYSIAMTYRARRCQSFWQSHLSHCHEILQEFYSTQPEAETLAILGSGLLLETPLSLVPQNIRKIYLVDVVHTKWAREEVLKFRKMSDQKVEFIDEDLRAPRRNLKTDLVVSANLLSQIARPFNKTDFGFERNEIQAAHVQLCRDVAPSRLLFSDHLMKIRNNKGELLKIEETVDSKLVTKMGIAKIWDWNLAPIPEVSSEYSIGLEVAQFKL